MRFFVDLVLCLQAVVRSVHAEVCSRSGAMLCQHRHSAQLLLGVTARRLDAVTGSLTLQCQGNVCYVCLAAHAAWR